MIVAIDCGTTNSRVYVVDGKGTVLGRGSRKVGVRDTSITGSRAVLQAGLRDAFDEALSNADIGLGKVRCILSNGMITSEIGLKELPHLEAPVSIESLAQHIEEVGDLGVFPAGIPVYFIRGIKNRIAGMAGAGLSEVGYHDFMRGEETQIAGILQQGILNPPFTVAVLSSHTKYISVGADGSILGSVTTLSGQLFEAIMASTSIGKSIQPMGDQVDPGVLDQRVIDSAYKWTREAGLLRSMLMPRFMDVLMQTEWYERKLFVESCIAAEDIKALAQFGLLGLEMDTPYVLIGKPQRCALYQDLLERKAHIDRAITSVCEDERIESLSIHGLLLLAAKNNLI
ncbi:MAG: hypothetical protein CVV52_02440 [Spirochaetae bacterium HGW-Spirochaetae-8]|nr:MAG: hypothetical protein CVV52_02440 [Spirochaetae bacterium HGW-Spirochaetae-8]